MHAAVEQLVAQVRARRSGCAATRSPGPVAERDPAARPQRAPPVRRRRRSTSSVVALEADDREAAALVAAHAQIAPAELLGRAAGRAERHRQPRLVLVGEPRDVGRRAGLLHHAEGLAALGEARERPALVAARRRAPAARAASPRRSRPSTPSEPTTSSRRFGPAADAGSGRASELPGRASTQRTRLDQLVDAPVAGRGLARRARGHPAADGRVLERLREVAERHALARRARRSTSGPSSPALEPAVSERPVHVEQSPSSRRRSSEIAAGEAVAHRLHAAHHARAAAERDHGHARAPRRRRARRATCSAVAGRTTASGAPEASPERMPHEVRVGAPDRVGHARLAVVAHVLGAHARPPAARAPAPAGATSGSRTCSSATRGGRARARSAPSSSRSSPRRRAAARRRARPRPSPTSASGLRPRPAPPAPRARPRPAWRAAARSCNGLKRAQPRGRWSSVDRHPRPAVAPARARSRSSTRRACARRATPRPRGATRAARGSSASTQAVVGAHRLARRRDEHRGPGLARGLLDARDARPPGGSRSGRSRRARPPRASAESTRSRRTTITRRRRRRASARRSRRAARRRQERQLDHERASCHDAARLLDELAERAGRAARGEQVVVHEHARAAAHRVGVHLERVDPVLELVLDRRRPRAAACPACARG